MCTEVACRGAQSMGGAGQGGSACGTQFALDSARAPAAGAQKRVVTGEDALIVCFVSRVSPSSVAFRLPCNCGDVSAEIIGTPVLLVARCNH